MVFVVNATAFVNVVSVTVIIEYAIVVLPMVTLVVVAVKGCCCGGGKI